MMVQVGDISSGVARYKAHILALLLVVFVSALAYFFVPTEKAVVSSNAGDETSHNPLIERCMEICRSSKAVGMDLSKGLCLRNNLEGYSCAVVVSDGGHCLTYFKGADEIVLDENCGFVGIYKKEGDSE